LYESPSICSNRRYLPIFETLCGVYFSGNFGCGEDGCKSGLRFPGTKLNEKSNSVFFLGP
jgi:hypothetical protein